MNFTIERGISGSGDENGGRSGDEAMQESASYSSDERKQKQQPLTDVSSFSDVGGRKPAAAKQEDSKTDARTIASAQNNVVSTKFDSPLSSWCKNEPIPSWFYLTESQMKFHSSTPQLEATILELDIDTPEFSKPGDSYFSDECDRKRYAAMFNYQLAAAKPGDSKTDGDEQFARTIASAQNDVSTKFGSKLSGSGKNEPIRASVLRDIENTPMKRPSVEASSKPNTRSQSKGVDRSKYHRGKRSCPSEFSPSPPAKRTTRSQSKQSKSSGEVIAIDDSSDEESSIQLSNPDSEKSEVGEVESVRPRRKRPLGDRATIDAVRIAVGKRVFRSSCEFSIQFGTKNPYLHFSCHDASGTKVTHCTYLKDHEITELKYFIASDDDISDDNFDGAKGSSSEDMTVIVFRITPTPKNGLDKYTNAYEKDTDGVSAEKRYISIELRSNEQFQAMLVQMREIEVLKPFLDSGAEMFRSDLPKFAAALIEDSRKDEVKRLSCAVISSRKRNTRSGRAGKESESENNLLLVYPFEVDENILTEAASTLKELSGDLVGLDEESVACKNLFSEKEAAKLGGDSKGSARTHYVTIREEDTDRLRPGEFLNDTLVDFWMRWISRGEQPDSYPSVHFFTTHFVSTLIDGGVEKVSTWTAKKNIDIFEKKFIFLPVNRNLHWSLCVVVNPALIQLSYDDLVDGDEEYPCILFLDSLKAHKKKIVAKHVRNWLNFEWNRLDKGKECGLTDPFTTKTMQLFDPKIPYQDNSWDCGVFACRYAYSIYLLRHRTFTVNDLNNNFRDLITTNPVFRFNMQDIARIRNEMNTLVVNLTSHYSEYVAKEKASSRARKKKIVDTKEESDKK